MWCGKGGERVFREAEETQRAVGRRSGRALLGSRATRPSDAQAQAPNAKPQLQSLWNPYAQREALAHLLR